MVTVEYNIIVHVDTHVRACVILINLGVIPVAYKTATKIKHAQVLADNM